MHWGEARIFVLPEVKLAVTAGEGEGEGRRRPRGATVTVE